MKIHPAGHRVLVKLKTVETGDKKSTGGIIIEHLAGYKAEAEQYATQEAYVVELGPTAYRDFSDGNAWCKVGDLVRIGKYRGENLKDEESGDVYRIIQDEDVVAIIEE